MGMSRLFDSAWISAMASLYICTQSSRSSGSDTTSEMPWPPRPIEFGKHTWAQMPESSITSIRALGSNAPKWILSWVHS